MAANLWVVELGLGRPVIKVEQEENEKNIARYQPFKNFTLANIAKSLKIYSSIQSFLYSLVLIGRWS